MAQFCTIDDLAAFLQIVIAPDTPSAVRAITEASAAIQNYCRQQIGEVVADQITLDCPGGTRLFLPELPVNEVSEVVEDGVTLTIGTDCKLGQYGILHRVTALWKTGIQIVQVTYSHGYDTGAVYDSTAPGMPDDITSVCTRAAARAYQSGLRAAALAGVAGVQGLTLGDYSVRYDSDQAGGAGDSGTLGASAAPILLPSEKSILQRFRLRGA